MSKKSTIEKALRLAGSGEPGRSESVQRLAWLLHGAAGWRLRAIWREEIECFPQEGILTVSFLVHYISRSNKVKHVIRTYLSDLEKSLIARYRLPRKD